MILKKFSHEVTKCILQNPERIGNIARWFCPKCKELFQSGTVGKHREMECRGW